MLKFTSVALGLLATAAISQPSLAVNAANTATNAIARPADNLHSQLIIKVGDGGYRRDRYYWERERARQRWESRQYRRWLRDRDYYRSRYDNRYDRRW